MKGEGNPRAQECQTSRKQHKEGAILVLCVVFRALFPSDFIGTDAHDGTANFQMTHHRVRLWMSLYGKSCYVLMCL